MTPEQENQIRESFDHQSMMTTFGASLDDLTPGTCRISAPILDGNQQQHGFGHAALTFGLGDTAAGYAAMSVMEPGHEVLTAEIKISLVSPAKGYRLIAEGTVLRAGRRLITVEAKVFAKDAGENRLIAVLLGTMVPVKPKPTAT
ncbi:PaaI family thioesterase [Aliiroseovarius sp. KMU-50]|uniref:PaaI family thioesterase n=1 Tax=Aliiroseovarius salicola TaxID=3009082 RepID=A0ABT4W0M8_9RHOB|nr:PaaI family thioesterase [Aliiroseovarius sp. KMU-50]MDA5094011.1 PaaI family thioesterase [Aliiroseovarius sp. KMU-50]